MTKKQGESVKEKIEEAVQIERAEIVEELAVKAESIRKRVDTLCRDTKVTFETILKTFRAHEDTLNNMLKKMDSMDEMMGLVLVAIRQNEYLQAYYPEQHGFPAGKYVGKHPAILMEGKRQ